MILRVLSLIVMLAAALGTPALGDPTPADTSAAAAPALPAGTAHDWQTGFLRPDRLQHASLAFGIGCGVGLVTRRAETGAGVALGLGLAKELIDDRFDEGDLLADAIGAMLAALAVAAIARGAGP